MNTILQKRIEEAAKRYAWSHDTIGVDKETFHTEASQKYPIPIDKHVRVPIQHEMEVAFKCAAHFILNNLWISVDEALPKENKLGDSDFVFVKTSIRFPFLACYSYKHKTWKDINHVAIHGVTHWMPIPELKGGEKCQ